MQWKVSTIGAEQFMSVEDACWVASDIVSIEADDIDRLE